MMGIDLNTVEEEEEEEEEGGPAARGGVCLQLWRACAGPVGPLPRKGSAVVYLPQGHLEHIGEAAGAGPTTLPPHVFCRVVDVNLQVRAPCARMLPGSRVLFLSIGVCPRAQRVRPIV